MIKRGDMLHKNDVLEVLNIDLVGLIHEDEAIIVATNKGEPAVYDKRSNAGKDFFKTAQRLLGIEVPFDELEESPSLLEYVRRLVRFGSATTGRRVRS